MSFRIFGSASLPVGIAVFHGLRGIGYVINAKRTLNFAIWVGFSLKMGLFLGSGWRAVVPPLVAWRQGVPAIGTG
jgi:hypothetical protein